MTPDAAFLQAILEKPYDDTLRLIYADHLEEQGQAERAEFIRVQCLLSRMGIAPYGMGPAIETFKHERDELRRRERELLQAPCVPGGKDNYHRWFDPFDEEFRHVPGDFGGSNERVFQWTFRRGFVSAISLACADFMRHAKALFRSQPILKVTLSNREPVCVTSVRPEPWTFPISDRPDRRNAVPWCVFESGGSREWHPTRESAAKWLSAACCQHGREAAELPSLKGDHAKAL